MSEKCTKCLGTGVNNCECQKEIGERKWEGRMWGVYLPGSENPESLFNTRGKAEGRQRYLIAKDGEAWQVIRTDIAALCWIGTNGEFGPFKSPIEQLQIELGRIMTLINSPEIENFIDGIKIEATHQREKWGRSHDDQKHPGDWTLLFVRQIGKMSNDVFENDVEKYKHHLITLAAIAYNCHKSIQDKTISGDKIEKMH